MAFSLAPTFSLAFSSPASYLSTSILLLLDMRLIYSTGGKSPKQVFRKDKESKSGIGVENGQVHLCLHKIEAQKD